MLRRQRPGAVGAHEVVVDHGAQVTGGQRLHLGHLVRGPEAVEEVQEGHARLERGRVGDQGEVHRLLHRAGRQHREAGGARGHHVAVVAEDGERLRGERAGGHVEDRRRQLAGDLVHVGDHQQEPLRRGEGRRQRSRRERPVQRARGPALALQLRHGRHRAPEIGATLGRPLVGPFPHGRGRRDRVDGDDVAELIRDASGRLVAVQGDVRPGGQRRGDRVHFGQQAHETPL